MNKKLHKIEVIVDKSIPYTLVLLLLIIIAEIFFEQHTKPYSLYIAIADYTIIAVFVVDLIFKYIRIKNIPKFLKTCWLDIIAVFPFFLIFRLAEYIGATASAAAKISTTAKFGEITAEGQAIFHEGLELEREASKVIEAAEKSGGGSRMSGLRKILSPKIMRPLLKSPRLLKIISFYERPTGDHHVHEKKSQA